MTTITIDRAVVEEALKTLEYYQHRKLEWDFSDELAVGDLRAALAQQAEPLNLSDPAVRKRLATQWGYVPAAQAEPVEPVAHRVVAGVLFDFMGWLTSRRERLVLSSTDDAAPAADAIKDFAEMRGLSLDDAKVQDWDAAPPQRKPLTEEEIESCRQKGYAHAGLSAPFDFGKAARAVERAVWEKNHG